MIETRRASLIACAVALTALFACTSSSEADPRPANAGALCREIAAAQVERLQTCDALEAPPEMYEMIFGCADFQNAQDEGRVVFDAAQGQSCLDAIRGLSCWEVRNSDTFLVTGGVADACRAAVAPQVAPGGTCASSLGIECADGYCAFDSFDACLAGGTCVARAQPGETCVNDFLAATCTTGSSCQYGCVDDVCDYRCTAIPAIVAVGLGETCDEDAPCEDAYFCQSPAEPGPSTCQPRAAAGESCLEVPCRFGTRCMNGTCAAPLQAGDDCSSGFCADGLHCNELSVCVRNPRVDETCGAPATESFAAARVDSARCVDSWCDFSEETPTCKPFRAPGSVCGLSDTYEDWVLSCGSGYACLDMEDNFGVCARVYCPMYL
jgi:hypothetical protein